MQICIDSLLFVLSLLCSLISNLTNMSHFHPLEFVSRGSETQIQVDENLNYLIERFKG